MRARADIHEYLKKYKKVPVTGEEAFDFESGDQTNIESANNEKVCNVTNMI